MSVYYKFNSELNYSYVDFDGLHISVSDLKKAILHQKRLGKSADFDLLISNAQTKEEYKDEQCLIPKNTSLIVARIPISNQHKKSWETTATAERVQQNTATETINHDISRMNGTEEDKIQAMMMQSTLDYDPTNYQRVRGSNQSGDVPSNYRCHKCHKTGHWIKNCPMNPPGGKEHHFKTRPEKFTGIPRSLRDNIGSENQEPLQSQFVEEKRDVPEDLICSICKGIFKDAVMVSCCGSSFCDECVRTALLESEDNECPDCKEKGTSPGSLIPNRFLRNAVAAFLSESRNVLNRDTQKKEVEEIAVVANQAEDEVSNEPQNFVLNDDIQEEEENEEENKDTTAEKDSESDDDDNITVTVPPAHQQSRGAAFRDSRMRRVPSHTMNEFPETPHSITAKNHDTDENYEDDSSDRYAHRQKMSSSRTNHNYESSASTPQGITTLIGDDKSSNQNLFHSSSHASNHNVPQGDNVNMYQQQQHHQPQPMYNQNQQHGMLPQMHSHSMYPQGPYHQPTGPYFPTNQLRPMRFEPQGNYHAPIRHHPHHMQSQMMRPSMHDNYSVRHQRPPINNLANAVSQNIQQRFGTGFIDDPLEAFNRIMREKEMRRDKYRRSPLHSSERRSRSFERKRSPAHPYSPDNRRQKNYAKTRKRSRSFKSNSRSKSRSYSPHSTRGKSRSISPRYRRRENLQNKDRRDDRHRSPIYRGNRPPRVNYKGEVSSKQGSRDRAAQNYDNQYEKNEQTLELKKDSNVFDSPHCLNEQPPPPGDDSELRNLQVPVEATEKEIQEEELRTKSDSVVKDAPEVNGSGKVDNEIKKAEHHHHHHKRSRGKNYETSSDDKKSRDKKKRKKSKEHDKKKNKKERKEKEKDKKAPVKTDSVEKTSEPTEKSTTEENRASDAVQEVNFQAAATQNEAYDSAFDQNCNKAIEAAEEIVATSSKTHTPVGQPFKRSDSVLDINPNIELEMDEWVAPEVSKWEREEIKSSTSLENSEIDSSLAETKRVPEEKVTSEILKRAENAIFARAISAIRPIENKKIVKTVQEHDVTGSRKETSPLSAVIKKIDNSTDARLQAFQVTVPTHESGTRSVEIKTSENTSKLRKSPTRTSIKNRLGIKVTDKFSESSDSRRKQYTKPLSSCISVSREARPLSRTDRGKLANDNTHSHTPNDRRGTYKRFRSSRSRSKSRHNTRRTDQRSTTDKSNNDRNNDRNYAKSKDTTRRSSTSRSKPTDPSLSDNDKLKAKSTRKGSEAVEAKKRARDLSSSSTSSTSLSHNGSPKHLKRHGKHKVKKRSRSLSTESNGNSKRKKSKKEKKAKKKKKSRK